MVILGQNNASSTLEFAVANAENSIVDCDSCWAFNAIGGTTSDPQAFGLGLPFFYGRNVFIGSNARTASGDGDPYVAF
jgi:hypothetical protein